MTKYILTIALAVLFTAVGADVQATAFTYQGRLTDASMPATGTYQMGFALYDAFTGGTLIGTPVENTAVAVSNGVFIVQLDFAPGAFSGTERYLEILVRRTATDGYVSLSPRQRVTSAPYAVRTSSAATSDNAFSLGGIPAGQYAQTNAAHNLSGGNI